MSDLFDAKLISGTARTVRELFAGRKYGLDFYQREYTWTEANVAELIDDLATGFFEDYSSGDERSKIASYRPYFLGPVVTSASGSTRYLVDGQQRLTTLTLLLIYLQHLSRDLDNAENLAPLVFSQKFGALTFNIDVDEREPVMRAILEELPFDPNSVDTTESVRNIWSRSQDIVELFPDDLKGEALVYFIDWLLERVVLVEIGTTDNDLALEIFETMNDRGLRLSNTDMLKGFLLARIGDANEIEDANLLWRQRITELTDADKNADSEFMKHWLRGKYAKTIRERKKDAVPGDFDLIGTAFHKWVRDHQSELGLVTAGDYATLVNRDFDRMSNRYLRLLEASKAMIPGLEHVFYNAMVGFTLQYLPIMAAVTPDDDDQIFRFKANLVAAYLDIFVARRMVNFRNFGYSTVVYTMFNLAKDVRDRDPDQLREILADRVADLEESFDGVETYRLTQRNRSHIRYLLARMTAWIEESSGTGLGFAEYVDRDRKKPFEVEHIWADKYERHVTEFTNLHDFADQRNRFGDLLLLPKDFNASYGAMEYLDKLPHYYGQNLLAASLSPLTYQNNPSFLRFVDESGLPFRSYAEGFTASDIDERQDLYREICEHVWSPDALGLGGGVASKATTPQSRQAFYGVDLSDLISSNLLTPGESLIGERSTVRYRAVVLTDGRIRIEDGTEFDSLSGAADALTGLSNNGWEFWRIDRDGDHRPLVAIREELLDAG